MVTEIVVALIGLCGSAIGSILGVIATSKLTSYRLQQLEEKVNKHNQIVERTYNLESGQKLIEQEIKVANHRIADLEKIERN